jgi:hypothetical protein
VAVGEPPVETIDSPTMRASQVIIAVLGSMLAGVVVLTLVSKDNKAPDKKAADKEAKRKAAATLIDVHELVGESKSSVTRTVGSEPVCKLDNVPDHGQGLRCTWASPPIDALFFEDKLRRAQITGAGVKFLPESGALYGIDSSPVFENDNVIRWRVDGYQAEIFHDGRHGVSYFLLTET